MVFPLPYFGELNFDDQGFTFSGMRYSFLLKKRFLEFQLAAADITNIHQSGDDRIIISLGRKKYNFQLGDTGRDPLAYTGTQRYHPPGTHSLLAMYLYDHAAAQKGIEERTQLVARIRHSPMHGALDTPYKSDVLKLTAIFLVLLGVVVGVLFLAGKLIAPYMWRKMGL